MRNTDDLRGHHRTGAFRVEVRAGKLAGATTGRITVTCNGQTRQFDTGRLAGVLVRGGSSVTSIQTKTANAITVVSSTAENGGSTSSITITSD